MNEDQSAIQCWARMAVRAMLVRVLLLTSNEFAQQAKIEAHK